jgi:flagellar hook protein FlgE
MTFQQGLSGLTAAARSLDVIGNNIANSGTIGAKAARVEFADAYANAIGGSAVPGGVTVSNVAQQFTQGDISTTSNPLDLAIDGPGFFKVSTGGEFTYTRNGQFRLDAQGYLVTAQGGRVQGNVIDPATGTLGMASTDIKTTTTTMAPKVTSEITLGSNLDARATAPAATLAFNPADPTTYNNVVSTNVYSQQGQVHTLGLFFRKTADNTWDAYGTFDGTTIGSSAGTPPVITPTKLLSGVTFDDAGRLVAPPAPGPTPAPTLTLPQAITVPFPTAEGGNLDVEVDFSKMTQFGSPFIVTDLTQNGYASGELSGFSVDPTGQLLARYTNGRSEAQARVLLTNFRNPQGLQPVGGNQWIETVNSGPATQLQVPGTGLLGGLRAGALEQSNVELTSELVNMITVQRVYQANAQTIRAQDQLLQTIVNLR